MWKKGRGTTKCETRGRGPKDCGRQFSLCPKTSERLFVTGAPSIERSNTCNQYCRWITLGAEFLTYVLWAITPEGRARNLGEFQLNGDKSKLTVTTQLH
jgi:hypothetical protein